MKKLALVLGLALLGNACTAFTTADDITPVDMPSAEIDPAGKAIASPKLNLSHIACTDDGRVLAHFVLLFAGGATPGSLSGTYSGRSFGPVAPGKNTGNVWHYEAFLPSGEIEITSASVVANGAAVSLHNPSEYTGDYQCGPTAPSCSVQVAPQDVLCTDRALTNPGAECAFFGLQPQGKDDNLTGLSFAATQNAMLAIVKSGNHPCEKGSSAYRIYTNVRTGDALLTPADQNISHVTYCACPD